MIEVPAWMTGIDAKIIKAVNAQGKCIKALEDKVAQFNKWAADMDKYADDLIDGESVDYPDPPTEDPEGVVLKPRIKDPPKGYWWCPQCLEKIPEREISWDNCKHHHPPIEVHGSPYIHEIEWHEQPEKPDEPAGMEQYIGMPCLMRENDSNWRGTRPSWLTSLKDGKYWDEEGVAWRYCKPHPISEEVLRLREVLNGAADISLERAEKHSDAIDQIIKLKDELAGKRKEHDDYVAQCVEVRDELTTEQGQEIEQLKEDEKNAVAWAEGAEANAERLEADLTKLRAELERYKEMERLAEDVVAGKTCRFGKVNSTHDTKFVARHILAALDTEEESK